MKITAALLAMRIAYLLLAWVRDQQVRGRLRDEDKKRFAELDRAWRASDPDSVQSDDPDLFRSR